LLLPPLLSLAPGVWKIQASDGRCCGGGGALEGGLLRGAARASACREGGAEEDESQPEVSESRQSGAAAAAGRGGGDGSAGRRGGRINGREETRYEDAFAAFTLGLAQWLRLRELATVELRQDK
jgi:hypothetical protein